MARSRVEVEQMTATPAAAAIEPEDDQARRQRLRTARLKRLMAIEPPPMREVYRGWFTVRERKIPAPRDDWEEPPAKE
jgi:hypothetical protein